MRTSLIFIPVVALLSATFPAIAVGAAPTVVINEVHYHPGDDSRDREFVELYNHGTEDVDLGRWILFNAVQYLIPPGTTIPAGGYLVIAANPAALTASHELDPATVLGPYSGTLSNEGELLELYTPGVYLASYVDYGDTSPWPETPDGLGPSLERLSFLLEEADAATWDASIHVGGTPGAANTVVLSDDTPGPPPGGDDENVEFIATGEEWRLFRGTEAPPNDWNEREFDDDGWERGNTGIGFGDDDDATVLTDMFESYLTVFVRKSFTVADPSRVTHLLLTIDYDDGFIAYVNGVEFARNNVSGPEWDGPALGSHEAGFPEEFQIVNPPGLLEGGENVLAIQGHNTSLTSSDFSLSPSFAGTLSTVEPPPPPPPPVGIERPARDLVINEIATGDADNGWVEIYNPTSSAVNASGRHLLVVPPSEGHFVIPGGTTIPAGGFYSPTESQLGFELDDIHACILTTEEDRFIDAMNPRTTDPGDSTGRFPDGSDNRVVMTDRTRNESNNYSETQPIVINEIMYHPRGPSTEEEGEVDEGNTGGEWIELYNVSNSTVDVSGWSFTRGITYTFPDGTTIPAGGYRVIAKTPAAVEAYYDTTDVLGPFVGGLDNRAETLMLRDVRKNVMDRVRYADEGSYPESTDGGGPSIELVNPALENRYGAAWEASDGEGSPGAENSRIDPDPLPIIVGVEHSPVNPSPSQSVHVLATVSDDRALTRVRLFYEVDEDGGSRRNVDMVDNGSDDDGIAGNGVHGATIPARSDGDIVAFWIEAEGQDDASVTYPPDAPNPACLYQVESPAAEEVRPRYRVVLRAADLTELRTRNRGSDELLDVTFIADGKAYYNRGIRYRGNSARGCDPLSYHVQFDHDTHFHGMKRLKLNGCNSWRQYIGLDFLRRVGMPTPQAWFRRLSLNGTHGNNWHLRVEAVDAFFLERNFPLDADGNLYRGRGQANFDYRGEDFGRYRNHYSKVTNEELDDYSDVVDASFRFDDSTTSDEDFPTAIEERVDVNQWAFYFAAFAMLGSTENSIVLNNGDDYFLYRRFSDDRWVLLPWDLDSCFDEIEQVLFRPTVDAIERLLQHPRYAPDYLCQLSLFLDEAWQLDYVNNRIDRLVPLFPESEVQILRTFATARRDFIEARLNQSFEITSTSGGMICDGTLYPTSSSVAITGRAPGCGTVDVFVNETEASFDYRAGTWTAIVNVVGIEMLEIVTRNRDGIEIQRIDLPVEEVVEAPQSNVHEQPPGETSVASLAVAYSEINDPDEDGNIWLEVGGVGSSLSANGTILQAPNAGFPRALDQSHAVYRFLFTRSGSYRGHFRARGFSGASNTVWRPSDFDTDPDVQLSISRNGNWRWFVDGVYNVTQDDVDAGRVFEIRVGVREFNAQLDAIVLSREAGLEAGALDALAAASGGGSNGLPRAIVEVSPDVEVTLDGDSEEVTLDGSLSHDGRCGRDTLDFLWEKRSGPAGDQFLDPVDQSTVVVRFTEPAGEYVYRLTVTDPVTGDEGTRNVTILVLPGVESRFQLCDSNGDGQGEVSDAVFTLLHLFRGGVTPPCEKALDCDANGSVTLGDAVFHLNYQFRGGGRPDAPFPACDSAPFLDCRQTTCSE